MKFRDLDERGAKISEIRRLKELRKAVILGHFYIDDELQDLSDYVGDSLKLSQIAATVDCATIVFLGVNFMAETAKILSPNKTVLLPDVHAGCSLADSCPPNDFKRFIEQNPNHTVISYVNTSAAIKALTDIVVTSSNAKQIVDSLPADENIIFGPDKNLGTYINNVTGRHMKLWNGACHVHSNFDMDSIQQLKRDNPDAEIIAHPECESSVLNIANHVGSTGDMLKYVKKSNVQKFIVVTEPGILYQMKKSCPSKIFLPPTTVHNACNVCNYMKMNNLDNLYRCLCDGKPEVVVDEELRVKAEKSIRRMLEISAKLGL